MGILLQMLTLNVSLHGSMSFCFLAINSGNRLIHRMAILYSNHILIVARFSSNLSANFMKLCSGKCLTVLV